MEELIKNVMAQLLWETQAVKVSVNKPFKLVSGNYSPIYINCRSLISNPVAMDLIAAAIHWWYVNHKIEADVIAGGETAGIPFAAYVAQRLAKPMVYVRKQPKGHGLGSAVEGSLQKGQRVLLVEDLITDGGSKEIFILGLRNAGAIVKDCLVVFDREQGGKNYLKKLDVNLHALCTIKELLSFGIKLGLLNKKNLLQVQKYIKDPEKWNAIRIKKINE